MLRGCVVMLLLAAVSAFVVPTVPLRTSAVSSVRVRMDQQKVKTESSALNVTPEQLAERRDRKKLINVALPGSMAFFFLVNLATGGSLQNIEFDGPTPPGVEEARALKKEKGYK